jgi:dTDP-4-amino-4,6-dideoxygalactose transaminase
MFYLVCNNAEQRSLLLAQLKQNGILAVFHYQSLHASPYYKDKYMGEPLPNSDKFSDTLVRLPLFYELKNNELDIIIKTIVGFYK